MGKKIKKVMTKSLLGDPLGLNKSDSAIEKQAKIAAEQLRLQQQQAAAANANLTLDNIANIQTGGTASAAEENRKKRGVGGGPVSTSIGLRV